MYIYKVTNLINQKVYIGQTTRTIQQRWIEHQYAAFCENKQTHFARALRKYGIKNFKVEQIDTAKNQQELNEKERYWIAYYNSCVKGYNSTDGGEEGNTYKYKTDEEMKFIKHKIRETKLGGKNSQARKVKCRNENTGEEYHFDSVSELQNFIQAPNHNIITKRCNHQVACLYCKTWNIAYEEDEYAVLTTNKNNHRAKQVQVTDLEQQVSKIFPSYAEAERFFNVPMKTFSGKAYRHKDKPFIVHHQYEIQILD